MLSGTMTNPSERSALMEWVRLTPDSDDYDVIEDSNLGVHDFKVDEDAKVIHLGIVTFMLLQHVRNSRRWHEHN